jgi:Protein of unknown function (DUF1549)/Protein of unknown function (DUF1553)/Planctomycete cytochrome C
MRRLFATLCYLLLCTSSLCAPADETPVADETATGKTAADTTAADKIAADKAAAEFFEKKIRPLLIERCGECHSTDKAADSGQLALDNRAALLAGGSRGRVVVAGKPDESLLLKAVHYLDPKLQMPPEGKLPQAEIDLLGKWVRDGAFVPEYGSAIVKPSKEIDWNAARQFWSFRPLTRVTIPNVPGGLGLPMSGGRAPIRHQASSDEISADSAHRISSSALLNPVDSFIVAKLGENGLAPSADADKRTLIRRVSFDLLGLPPSPEDVAEFVADDRQDAYERLVDRLLASPHFGERWARYWLDLARYVDDTPDWQKTTEQAWMYRDWVVRAFNEDRPYDQFAKLQLAADVMPDTAPEDYAALGFVGLSPQYWKELKLAPAVIEVIVADEWDERLDAVSRTFLGLTIACARCHDHKFDPITTRDYYALAGVFASTDLSDRPLLPSPLAEQVREARHNVDSLRESLKKVKDKESDEARKLQQQIDDIRTATPQLDAPLAPTIEEASVFVMPNGPDATKLDIRKRQPRDLPIFRRGNPSNPGDIVPRRFLELFSSKASQPFQEGSGRRELAEALFHDAQGLTARVIVNRIWSHHFGRGLVKTPSDFGHQGERPSHPELLDWLSDELVCGYVFSPLSSGESGGETRAWSLKQLHRLLVNSATYRQSSGASDSALRTPDSALPDPHSFDPRSFDPDNNLLGRMNRRRLEIESWRDAMLDVANNLNDTLYGPALSLDLPTNRRRTLYGKIGREEQNDMLRTFDFPPPTAHSPARDVTTTPLQQLFVLNSDFVEQQSATLAARILALPDSSTSSRIDHCYELLFQRSPNPREKQLGERFLAESTGASASELDLWRWYVQSLLGLNEFLFVD